MAPPREFKLAGAGSQATTAPAIRAIGIAAVADYMKVDRKTVRRWVEGERRPGDPVSRQLVAALVVLGHRADLFTQSEEGFTGDTLLPLIPQRVEFVRINVWYFVNKLARIYRGMRGLARAMAAAEESTADFEPTIRRWCAYSKLPRDLSTLNAIVERIARFCRAEAVSKGRTRSPKLGTPAENRRVVLWYLDFVEDPDISDSTFFDGGDNLLIAVRRVGLEPDAAFYESLADGEPRAWPVQLLPN